MSLQQDASSALAQIRRESLDMYNRLHSIAEDSAFVDLVHNIYMDLPLMPNLRCGAWYTDPDIATSTPAYFKSTDGHYGNWSFNLRRPNLHLLPLVIDRQGLVLVDSTRCGKRIPDAFSKTVPIWCAVINRAMSRISPSAMPENWDTALYTPPHVVSAQEHVRIEALLDGWADALVASSYELPYLRHPLRPLWITPATSTFPRLRDMQQTFFPVVCLSASRQVQDGIERRVSGYAYIQGSGDDHELWGMGLAPKNFWNHRDKLLQASRSDLATVVESIVSSSAVHPGDVYWAMPPSAITKSAGKLFICSNLDLPSPLPSSFLGAPFEAAPAVFLQICTPEELTHSCTHQLAGSDHSDYLRLSIPEGKRGQLQFLQSVLPQSMSFISNHLRMDSNVCISCDTGKDKSIGVALAALQRFFDDNGNLITQDEARPPPDKRSIKTRLQWIISSRPQANPSRSTLKRVNEFLLTPALFNRSTPVASSLTPRFVTAACQSR